MKKGRKKLTCGRKKERQIKARFTNQDYQEVLTKSKAAGLKPSVFVAKSAIKSVIKMPLSKDVVDSIKELGVIGKNMNQIARKINTDSRYSCQETLNNEIVKLTQTRLILLRKIMDDRI